VVVTDAPVDGAVPSAGIPTLAIKIERALGAKCERCWNYSVRVGESAVHPTFCERCVAAIEERDREKAQQDGAAA
jgi:isoleucyl-tRNA synthetase